MILRNSRSHQFRVLTLNARRRGGRMTLYGPKAVVPLSRRLTRASPPYRRFGHIVHAADLSLRHAPTPRCTDGAFVLFTELMLPNVNSARQSS
ncbi:hypothetical protein CBM2637_A30014 [Cupriavidus taiwanensis]|nr:hypothetical protein CBM2637_A30014 [Cupriavidus taiwanensis]